jgi:hypothetical protein
MNAVNALTPVSNYLGLVGQESASGRPASVRCNNRHSVLPRHGIFSRHTSNTLAAHESQDGTTRSLLLMVVEYMSDSPPAERTKSILGLS